MLITSVLLARVSPVNHFQKRAEKYDCSSEWVHDPVLINKIKDLVGAGPDEYLLDIGVGTGKISRAFKGEVSCLFGVDICMGMVKQARLFTDKIILSYAEKLPFKDNIFDVCVCRQALQFMRLEEVCSEMHRVLKPGGRLVLCHLTAYGEGDKKETFLIQKLRNPARKNFFLPGDFPEMLKKYKFSDLKSFAYITRESVNQWINHGAICEDDRVKIREAYRKASGDFKRIHKIQFSDTDIFDSMKMVLVRAIKKKSRLD
ncbi:MAG: class I SAM-dependent methyltransferase [Candidatus Omnitrophica bacterium]|nr:class I SAM-dependent methyltransferase [Candidatus Omnitrophota bacterium]MBU1923199.1 class I SAM-dependent methyltransferase [Candidatus Omnitrophota bacterium]